MFGFIGLMLHVFFVKEVKVANWATPPHMAMSSEEAQQLSSAVAQYAQQAMIVGQQVYQSAQQLFWEQRRKRGPPTPAFSSTGLATPSGQGDVTEGDVPAAASTTTPPSSSTTPPTGLFQPVVLGDNSAYQAVAHSMGVDVNNTEAVEKWMAQPVTTRADVLHTVRHYHTAVIRPELYNLVNQIEVTLLGFDDRLLRQSRELQWMAADNRAEQTRASGLTVLLTGSLRRLSPQRGAS